MHGSVEGFARKYRTVIIRHGLRSIASTLTLQEWHNQITR